MIFSLRHLRSLKMPCQMAALGLCFQHWKAQRVVDQRVDPEIEQKFNKVFMTASKDGREAVIKGWTDRKKCSREEAMRRAVEDWRWQNW